MAKVKSRVEPLEPEIHELETVELADDLTKAYIGYARETITDRALPDVRDGLKPVQRRIMYTMHDLRLFHDQPHKKSARVVGDCLGKLHPHGDQSVYYAMVRMAQPWVMNIPLVDGQGNWGSIDGDAPAAMRYTECRLTAVAETMLQDLDMETVEWMDNFDGSLQEPTVLPTVLPNLLVNGADGIAVGMATRMPPHNLGEVCDALIHVAQNWQRRDQITVDELMTFIPGPDFPTGGIVYRYRDDGAGAVDSIRQAYAEGRGRIVMQSRLATEDIGGGKANIIVTELPYGVLKSTVIEKIAKEVRDGRIGGVTDLRDESDHSGMRVVIEVSRQASPQEVLKQVLKYSQLRETFGVINLALAPGNGGSAGPRPVSLSLRDLLTHFIAHRLEVIERRSWFELKRRNARLHIVLGLLKALDILDQVIETIRRSQTADTARENLIKKFGFTEPQATAILDMQLRRLAALERKKLAEEKEELEKRIQDLEKLLEPRLEDRRRYFQEQIARLEGLRDAKSKEHLKQLKGALGDPAVNENNRLGVVAQETRSLKERFATPRRTIILDSEDAVAGSGVVTTEADLAMPEGTQMLVLMPDGVQRTAAAGFSYRASRELTKRPVGEVHLAHVTAEPADQVILLTSRGRGWKGPVGFVPAQGGSKELGLERGEQLIGLAVLRAGQYLTLGTRLGKVKRTLVEDLSIPDRAWGVVMGLSEGDELLFGAVAAAGADVLFYTVQGQLLRIDGDAINPQQTGSATGVAGIKLREGDRLLGGSVVPDGARQEDRWQVVVVSTTGYVHRAALADFPTQGRGATGVRCLAPTKSGGDVAGVAVAQGGVVDIYLADNRRQRLDVKEIPLTAREARGERLVQADARSPVARVVYLPG